MINAHFKPFFTFYSTQFFQSLQTLAWKHVAYTCPRRIQVALYTVLATRTQNTATLTVSMSTICTHPLYASNPWSASPSNDSICRQNIPRHVAGITSSWVWRSGRSSVAHSTISPSSTSATRLTTVTSTCRGRHYAVSITTCWKSVTFFCCFWMTESETYADPQISYSGGTNKRTGYPEERFQGYHSVFSKSQN